MLVSRVFGRVPPGSLLVLKTVRPVASWLAWVDPPRTLPADIDTSRLVAVGWHPDGRLEWTPLRLDSPAGWLSPLLGLRDRLVFGDLPVPELTRSAGADALTNVITIWGLTLVVRAADPGDARPLVERLPGRVARHGDGHLLVYPSLSGPDDDPGYRQRRVPPPPPMGAAIPAARWSDGESEAPGGGPRDDFDVPRPGARGTARAGSNGRGDVDEPAAWRREDNSTWRDGFRLAGRGAVAASDGGGLRQAGRDIRGGPGRRVLNAVVAGTDERPLTEPLPTAATFLLLMSIGPPDAASVLTRPRPFPDHLLPTTGRGWDLVVIATSDDVAVDDRPHLMFLPRSGPSWSCPCPAGWFEHRCDPEQRRAWLALTVDAPAAPGPARITVRVYYGAVLLQAVDIDVTIGRGSYQQPPPTGSVVYSRDAELRDLDRHDHRGLSCHLTPSSGAWHTLVVNNGYNQPVRIRLADRQGDTAAVALRRALHATQLDEDGVPRHRVGPGGQPVKDAGEYLADLRRLAGAGSTVYRALMSDSVIEQRLRDWLDTEVLMTDAAPVIQVARSATARLSVPWQALYSEPLVDGPARAAICPSVWEWGPGGGGADPPPQCPHRDDHDPVTGTICPFGFWGLSNVLEHPPSSLTRILPRVTGADRPAEIVAAVNETLTGYRDHLRRITAVTDGRPVQMASTWRQLREVAAAGSDILYFFCHGLFGTIDDTPVEQPILDLGNHDWITPGRLGSWASVARWQHRQPLVILNGCGTGDMASDLLAGFVDAFVDSLRAAGVVATEIAVESLAAQYAAETLLTQLWQGATVGLALRRTRWRLLSTGSVLGLAYTPYCDAFLTLPRTENDDD